jgi:hypothetical protein
MKNNTTKKKISGKKEFKETLISSMLSLDAVYILMTLGFA